MKQYTPAPTLDEIAIDRLEQEEAEREEIRRSVRAYEKAKEEQAKIRLTLTAEELEIIDEALIAHSVKLAEEAEKREKKQDPAEIIDRPNIWRKQWRKNGEAWQKIYEAQRKIITRYK